VINRTENYPEIKMLSTAQLGVLCCNAGCSDSCIGQ
jgi:hypothetical protein